MALTNLNFKLIVVYQIDSVCHLATTFIIYDTSHN